MSESDGDVRRVKPELPGGFRDYLPREMIARAQMIRTIQGVFERFGFDPLETPGMERRQVLTGGQSLGMVIYDTKLSSARIRTDEDALSDRTALRFDLTVPLARVVAANLGGGIRLPFKRYQVGNVWRGEKPQEGRFREFMQFDADIVGSATPIADAEIVALMVATLHALGIIAFEVLVNNRKILNALPVYAGFPVEETVRVFRVIDKVTKIGRDGVRFELTAPPRDPSAQPEESNESADERSQYGLGLSMDVADRIGAFLDIAGTTDEILAQCEERFGGILVAAAGLAELRAIVDALRSMGVPEENWRIDLSIARGLAYYTGPVFETFLIDERVRRLGSVFSGGRYDDLVNRFTDASIPATGASVGVDRLFVQLERLGMIVRQPTRAQVLVTVMDPTAMTAYLAATGELRGVDIRTMLWLGEDPAFRGQIAYAAAQEIPVVVIMGADELRAGTVTIKNMVRRVQQTVPRELLVAVVRELLGGA